MRQRSLRRLALEILVLPECYARRLRACQGSISREHYVSAGVMRLAGEHLTITGAPGVPDGRQYPVQALATKILCERHNAMLSPLDAEAEKFVAAVRRFDQEIASGSPVMSERRLIHGDLIERWMLKVAVGLAAANRRAGRPASVRLEQDMIAVLFGVSDWPDGWGLYTEEKLGDQLSSPADLALETVVAPETLETWALRVWCRFVPVLLVFGHPDQLQPEAYRPGDLDFNRVGDRGIKRIRLTWPDRAAHRRQVYTRTADKEGWTPIGEARMRPQR